MEIPKQFKEELERRLKEEKKEKKKAEEKRKASEEKTRKLRDEEDSRLETKLGICKKIFDWKDEFLKTEEGLVLLGKYQQIKIYGGRWGHTIEMNRSIGCWSNVHITKDAVEYTSGYKWMPSSTNIYNRPRQMVNRLNHEYIQELLDTLDNGKVFGYILKFNK